MDGIGWQVDRHFDEYKVGLGLQGAPYHHATPDREKDYLKGAKLAQVGIVLVYVSDTRFELEPDAALDDLEKVLASRGWKR